MIEDEEQSLALVRYDPEQNIEMFGLTFNQGEFKWVNAGVFSLAGAN